MARLPTPQESLGGLPSLRSGAPIARYDTSAAWSGVADLGQSLANAAASLQVRWDGADKQATALRYQAWEFEEAKRYDAAVRDMKPGQAKGFADSYTAGYFERAKAFKQSLPEDLKPGYDARLSDYEQKIYADALDFERVEQKRFSLNMLDDTVRTVFLPKVNMAAELPPDDPAKATLLAEAEEAANQAINDNPALTDIEKDEQRRKVRELLQTGFAKALPPEERIFVDPNVENQTIGERIRAVESGGNPNAANPSSSALGADQFVKGTWLGLIRKYRPDIAKGRSNAEIAALRSDPDLSAQMRDLYVSENAAYLKARGIGATPGNIYLAHFLGPAGAAVMLNAHPSTPADAINPQAAKANPAIFYANGRALTAGEISAWASSRMSGTRHTDWGRRLDAVPYDTKVAIAVDGGADMVRREADRKAAETAAYGARLNAAQNAILDNRFGLSDVLGAYDEGRGWLKDATDRKALIEMIEKRDKESLTLARAANKFSDTSYEFNAFSKDDRDAANLYYDKGPTKAGAGLLEGDAQAVGNLRSIIARSGIVPSSAVDTIRSGLWSRDTATRDTAFSIMDGLYRENPAAVGRAFNETDIARLQDYEALAPLLPPEELATRMDPGLNPQEMERRKKLRQEGEKLAAKIDTGEILGAFDPSFLPFDQPAEVPDPMVSLALRTDFEALFAERYAVTGQEDTAKTQAVERLKNKWGRTEVGTGNYLLPYPPEQHYNAVEGSYDWMDAQLQEYVEQHSPGAEAWFPIPTPETEAVVAANRAGQPWQAVPYGIGVIDKDGVMQVLSTRAAFDYEKARGEALERFEERRRVLLENQIKSETEGLKRIIEGQPGEAGSGTGAGPGPGGWTQGVQDPMNTTIPPGWGEGPRLPQ